MSGARLVPVRQSSGSLPDLTGLLDCELEAKACTQNRIVALVNALGQLHKHFLECLVPQQVLVMLVGNERMLFQPAGHCQRAFMRVRSESRPSSSAIFQPSTTCVATPPACYRSLSGPSGPKCPRECPRKWGVFGPFGPRRHPVGSASDTPSDTPHFRGHSRPEGPERLLQQAGGRNTCLLLAEQLALCTHACAIVRHPLQLLLSRVGTFQAPNLSDEVPEFVANLTNFRCFLEVLALEVPRVRLSISRV